MTCGIDHKLTKWCAFLDTRRKGSSESANKQCAVPMLCEIPQSLCAMCVFLAGHECECSPRGSRWTMFCCRDASCSPRRPPSRRRCPGCTPWHRGAQAAGLSPSRRHRCSCRRRERWSRGPPGRESRSLRAARGLRRLGRAPLTSHEPRNSQAGSRLSDILQGTRQDDIRLSVSSRRTEASVVVNDAHSRPETFQAVTTCAYCVQTSVFSLPIFSTSRVDLLVH